MKDNIASESKYTCAGFDTGFIFCRGGGGGGRRRRNMHQTALRVQDIGICIVVVY